MCCGLLLLLIAKYDSQCDDYVYATNVDILLLMLEYNIDKQVLTFVIFLKLINYQICSSDIKYNISVNGTNTRLRNVCLHCNEK